MKKQVIKKILVLNRGEIACRIIQAAQELGKKAVAIYSDADKGMRATQIADEAIAIGGTSAKESYLHLEKLVALAKAHHCDAVHPGYGFLSERADAAEAFTKAGITWIGPSADSIAKLGNKIGAKQLLEKAKIPTLPWCTVNPSEENKMRLLAQNIGFPLLLKAAAGGGGKGMRLVHKIEDLFSSAESAAREGLSAFGDATIFMEKYLENPKHIEVQVLGDLHGNLYHFGERDCSSQRRHQKVIEEAPASHLKVITRNAICEAGARLAQSMGYASAGTAEFLVDEKENFYFLEMNSRLQVEHTVTELVWGIDLVQAQIRIAEGATLEEIVPDYKNKNPQGHAIQARIYAEDAANLFMPSPGPLLEVCWPTGQGIRVDTGVRSGDTIGLDYDPMIAKLSVWAENREKAIEKILWALRNTVIFGTTTNSNYLQDILASSTFRNGEMHVKFLETTFRNWKDIVPEELLAEKENIFSTAAKASTNSNVNINSASQFPSPWEGK